MREALKAEHRLSLKYMYSTSHLTIGGVSYAVAGVTDSDLMTDNI